MYLKMFNILDTITSIYKTGSINMSGIPRTSNLYVHTIPLNNKVLDVSSTLGIEIEISSNIYCKTLSDKEMYYFIKYSGIDFRYYKFSLEGVEYNCIYIPECTEEHVSVTSLYNIINDIIVIEETPLNKTIKVFVVNLLMEMFLGNVIGDKYSKFTFPFYDLCRVSINEIIINFRNSDLNDIDELGDLFDEGSILSFISPELFAAVNNQNITIIE